MRIEVLGAAVFAALVAIAVTMIIEKLGGKLGGLIGTLPTTIVPASIGIYAEAEDFEMAMWAVPVGMAVNVLFLWSWRWLPSVTKGPGRLLKVLFASLGIWLIAATGAVFLLNKTAASLEVVALGTTLSIASVGIWACKRNPPSPSKTRQVSLLALLSRGLFAGTAIAIAVLLSKHNPLIAGLASVFPAIFLTTMVSLWLGQGEAFQASAVGPMMLGSTAVALYALIATYSFPAWGIILGTSVAWFGASLGATLPAWLWLQRQAEQPAS
jgi:hypothetical protein